MKAIVEYTQEELDKMNARYKDLREKTQGKRPYELLSDYSRCAGYGHYKFSGVVTQEFIDLFGAVPSPVDVLLIVDGGFSHFGASCTMDGLRVRGRVNTD